jgi:Flp pilus assembly protein TadG
MISGRARLAHYLRDENGGPAAEMGLFILLLAPIIFNLMDVGVYIYKRMQVQNAAQAGAQAVWAVCTKAPVTATPCSTNVATAVTGGIQSTSLGSGVTWSNSGSFATDAAYKCPDGTDNAFTNASSGTSCTSTGAGAGYYAKISVSYAYTPLFAGATVASLLPTPITATTWMRIE